MKKVIIIFLIFYKKAVSPYLKMLFGNACVYKLSCSEYAAGSIKKHGIVKGAVLSTRRLLSCNTLFKSASLENIQ